MKRVFQKSTRSLITSEAQLREVIPAYPSILDKRIMSELDHYCLELIGHSSVAIFASADERIPIDVLHHDQLLVVDNRTIQLVLASIDRCDPTTQASFYFLIPGVGHGLRVNGVLQGGSFGGENITFNFTVEGAYVHCARAAARSKLWDDHLEKVSTGPELNNPDVFLKHSPYLMIKTMNKAFETELSPRGDQPGFVQRVDENTVFIPERPGNKVAISIRNIIQNSLVELLMFIPGSNRIMKVKGQASVTTQEALLDASTVNSKRPKLGLIIESCEFEISSSDALVQAHLWALENHVEGGKLTRFSNVLSAHMNGEGLLGKATVPVVSAIVKHDMKNLY